MTVAKSVQLSDLFIAIGTEQTMSELGKGVIQSVVKDLQSQGVTMDKETLHQDAERVLGDHLTKLKLTQRDNPFMPKMVMYSPETAKKTKMPLFVINMTHLSLGNVLNYLREEHIIA